MGGSMRRLHRGVVSEASLVGSLARVRQRKRRSPLQLPWRARLRLPRPTVRSSLTQAQRCRVFSPAERLSPSLGFAGATQWVTFTDEASGDNYYHNPATGITTWDKPAELV
jgi:hypothetical protein